MPAIFIAPSAMYVAGSNAGNAPTTADAKIARIPGISGGNRFRSAVFRSRRTFWGENIWEFRYPDGPRPSPASGNGPMAEFLAGSDEFPTPPLPPRTSISRRGTHPSIPWYNRRGANSESRCKFAFKYAISYSRIWRPRRVSSRLPTSRFRTARSVCNFPDPCFDADICIFFP